MKLKIAQKIFLVFALLIVLWFFISSFAYFLSNGPTVFFIISVCFLVVLLLISFLLTKYLTKPINQLVLLAENLRDGKSMTKIPAETDDDVGKIANSFSLMTQKLTDTVSELQKKVTLLEDQKKRLDITAKLLLKRDLNVREFNEALEVEKEAIVAERNKLAVILSGISDAVIAVDLEKNIVLFNTAAEQLTGLLARDVIKQPIYKIIKIYDEEIELSDDVYSPVRDDDFEGVVFTRKNIHMVTKSNKDIYVNLITGKIKESNSSNLGCILTFHDVTGEKRLEEMKLDFVSMAAHELRTPLTAIRGYAHTLEQEINKSLNEEQKEYMRRLLISTKNLNSLIDNLLNVSRIERGKFKVELAPCRLPELVDTIISTFTEIAKVKNQTLVYKPSQEKIPLVLADQFRVGQVLSNLLANAINYTKPEGSISVEISKRPPTEKQPNEYVVVSVSDTGQGIPKEALPQLFTKFFRVSGALEQGSKGTGLGLFISKSIIDMHKGEIWVESTFGKGSTFSFSLPVATQKDLDKISEQGGHLSDTHNSGMILNTERYKARLKK